MTSSLPANSYEKLRVDYAGNKIHNPALQHHYDFLAAKYLNEQFEPAKDESLPWYPSIKEVSRRSLSPDTSILTGIDINVLG
jgi:hypothetical protein